MTTKDPVLFESIARIAAKFDEIERKKRRIVVVEFEKTAPARKQRTAATSSKDRLTKKLKIKK